MLKPTVNNCYYGNGTNLLRPELYKAFQGLHLYVWFSIANVGANECFFSFKKNCVVTCIFHWGRKIHLWCLSMMWFLPTSLIKLKLKNY